MSTETAELATGHVAAISAAGVQHTKRTHDKSEPSRSLSIRAYAFAGRGFTGVRGLFSSSRSPRLKASPSDELESFVLHSTPPGAFDKPPRCGSLLSHRRPVA